MTYPLQNTPGSYRYPANIINNFLFKQLSFGRRATAVILIALGLLFAATIGGPIMVLAGLLIIIVETSKERREQKKYYSLSKMTPLTGEQLEALQLGTFFTYDCDYWCDSLETVPCEQRVKKDIKKFKKLRIFKTENLVDQLEEGWGIISRDDYLDSYKSLTELGHTRRFVHTYYASEEPDKIAQRLCGLIQKPKEAFDALFNEQNGVRKLIWAWDMCRAINNTRCAYESGFITEDEAWSNILAVSRHAHTIYDSLDEFFMGVRFGHAFWCDDFKKVKERGQLLDRFLAKKTRHRVLHASWSKLNEPLPKAILDGFKEDQQKIELEKFESRLAAEEPNANETLPTIKH